MSDNPDISVIMPVYNAGKYVSEAVQSILDQSFSNFEFIIINDGSTDESFDVIKSFNDKRIKILNNPANIGNYPSRNMGLNLAKGKYICVMDADDIALPKRFERQLLFMEENPEIGLAGSGFRYYGKNQVVFRENDYEKIKVILLRNNCFIHSTLIMRHDLLKKYNLQYNEKYYYSADYDLIAQAARYFHITNIPEVLLHYRVHDQQITLKNRARQMEYANYITIEQLRYIGIDPDENEIQLNSNFLKGISIVYSDKQTLYNWIKKILTANQNKKYYKDDELKSFLNSLLSMQAFCSPTKKNHLKTKLTVESNKQDLTDVTFLIRLRIDSTERIENTNAIISFLTRHFKTFISVLEVDNESQYPPQKKWSNIRYDFMKDKNEVFHKTKWTNQMISLTDTPFVAIWDVDSIAAPEQIVEAVNVLRIGETVLSYPYDGRFYSCDSETSTLFKNLKNVEILQINIPLFRLMHSYYSSGGAFIVNKKKYITAGGENKNIFGWGLEDAERLKRMETLSLPVHNSKGPLFHLWHPKGSNSRFVNMENEIRNRKEFLKVCNITN